LNPTTNSVIVVSDREEYVQWLIGALDNEREVVIADEDAVERILMLVDASSATVIFVQMGGGETHSHATLIEGLLAVKPGLAIVAISTSDESNLLLSAMRAGARDFLRVGSDPRDVLTLVQHLEEMSPREAQPPAVRNKVFSFLSSRPYEGVTTLAVHAALAMLERGGADEQVLLLDLGMPPADTLLTLDLKSSYSFIDAIRSVRRFDQTLIRTAFTRHESGLTILSLPEDTKGMEGVTAADVMILLNVLRSYFNRIVIHLGGVNPTDFVRLILSKSDRTMLVVEQSVPSCKSGRQLLDHLATHDYHVESIGLVVDRYTTAVGLNADDIAELLGMTLVHTLPPSGMVRLKALNAGRSIFDIAPSDPYAKGVRALVEKLSGNGGSWKRESGAGSILRRWFDRLF
jgi:pilus assembly protein CpaE